MEEKGELLFILADYLLDGKPCDESVPENIKKPFRMLTCGMRFDMDVDADYEGADFETVWDMYDKKVGRKKCEAKWRKIPFKKRLLIMRHVPMYVASTPDKKYRKNFETYLNQEAWNDEIIQSADKTKQSERYGRLSAIAKAALGSVQDS